MSSCPSWLQQRASWSLGLVWLALIISCSGANTADVRPQVPSACQGTWTSLQEPQIASSDFIANFVWNDPTVLKTEGGYVMWLSGADPTDLPIRVQIYRATSIDGTTWTLNTTPVLEPDSNLSAWDSGRIETPSVIKVGSTYHLYYSGCKGTECDSAIYQIGHATSNDGISWTKDASNPILTLNPDANAWGGTGVGEPAAFYDDMTSETWLYFVAARSLPSDLTIKQAGILLAKSNNGSYFNMEMDGAEPKIILSKEIPGAPSGAWFGYSTPSVVRAHSGSFKLFYSLLIGPTGPASVRLMSVQEAHSNDGIHFTENSGTLLQVDGANWINQNVRSPAALVENNEIRLWFAGETRTPLYRSGIGEIQFQCIRN